MKRRETIIIILMIVAIVYAAYSFIFDQPEESSIPGITSITESGDASKGLSKFVARVLRKINKKNSVVDVHIIKMAMAEWKRDPFMSSDLYEESGIKGGRRFGKSKNEIIYSGYIKLGKKMLAVINGIEYEEGETLETGVYIVSDIMPSAVVLKNNVNKTITLPLEETIRDE